jgi:hypothetical protein
MIIFMLSCTSQKKLISLQQENENLEKQLKHAETEIEQRYADSLNLYQSDLLYYQDLANELGYENEYLKRLGTSWEWVTETSPDVVETPEEVRSSETNGGVSSGGVRDESGYSGLDSTTNYSDTAPEVIYSGTTSGNVAIYCPREMVFKETSDIFGFISDLLSDEYIRSRMIDNLKEHNENFRNKSFDDDDLLIREISYYNLVELKLMDSDNTGFDILKVHEDDKQAVQADMEGWHWKVTPNSEEMRQQLVFKVIIYNEDGTRDDSFSKTYQVTIKVNSWRFFQNTKMLIIENPEWAIGTLLLPFISFLWGRYQGTRKKKTVT